MRVCAIFHQFSPLALNISQVAKADGQAVAEHIWHGTKFLRLLVVAISQQPQEWFLPMNYLEILPQFNFTCVFKILLKKIT